MVILKLLILDYVEDWYLNSSKHKVLKNQEEIFNKKNYTLLLEHLIILPQKFLLEMDMDLKSTGGLLE